MLTKNLIFLNIDNYGLHNAHDEGFWVVTLNRRYINSHNEWMNDVMPIVLFAANRKAAFLKKIGSLIR